MLRIGHRLQLIDRPSVRGKADRPDVGVQRLVTWRVRWVRGVIVFLLDVRLGRDGLGRVILRL